MTRAPSARKAGAAAWSVSTSPEITIWPGALSLAFAMTPWRCHSSMVTLTSSGFEPRIASIVPDRADGRLLHQGAAPEYQRQAALEVEDAGSNQRRVLAEAVPGHDVRPDAALAERRQAGAVDGEDRRLGVRGPDQLLARPLVDELPNGRC